MGALFTIAMHGVTVLTSSAENHLLHETQTVGTLLYNISLQFFET